MSHDDGMYRRPTRDEIAARVKGTLPGAPAPKPPMPALPPAAAETRQAPRQATAPGRAEPQPPDYPARYATHLAGRMRTLGWMPADLAAKAGVHWKTASRAIKGTSVGLDIAARLAAAVGLDLVAMLQPYACGTCHGEPPAGFTCNECGTQRTAS